MSLFNKKKKAEEKEEEKVKSPIEKHKELYIRFVYTYGTHNTCTSVAQDENDCFDALKETIRNNIGNNYILETANGAHNLKYFCSVTFEEREVSEVDINSEED